MRLALGLLWFAELLIAQGSPDLVISQIYGGGGNTGAPFRNDFIELFNRGKSPVNINGWSVQYTSAAGTEWQVTPLSGSVEPGHYYLIREAEGANTAATELPAPEATGNIAMGAGAGKVALVRTTAALAGARPLDGTIADFVGYGRGSAPEPNGFEGAGPTASPANATAVQRRGNGCLDTDNNTADFSVAAPVPRNGSARAVNCEAVSTATPLRISEIQGPGPDSPVTGQLVVTSGVVTGVRRDGLWIQSLPADDDQNPATSEGLWVYTAMSPPGSVNRGYVVRVTGTVNEFRPASDPGSPTLTEVIDPQIEVLGQGQPLPAPVVLPAGKDRERYEGMRVAVSELRTVSGTLGSVTESSAAGISNGVFYGVLPGQPRPYRAPGTDDVPERLRVDTAGQGGTAVDVSTGATVRNLVGPLDFAFRTYSLVQDAQERLEVRGGMTSVSLPAPEPGEFSIAAANLQRFFDDQDDATTADPVLTSAALQRRIDKTSGAIRNVLQSPDVLAVEEVENIAVLRRLATALGDYDAQLFEGNDIGGIDVGLLTKRGRVQVLSASQEGKGTMLGTDRLWDRPPLVARLSIENVQFTAIVVHLRSLINADTATVAAKRRAQAEALRDLIAARSRAGEQLVVLGDFNTLQFDPLVSTIRSGGALTNLTDVLPPNENYSYVQDGVTQTLDHILVSEGMRSRLIRVQFAHSNADFPVSFSGDVSRLERASDHDVPVAWFSLAPDNLQLIPAGVTNAATFLTGSVAPLEIITVFGRNIGPATPALFAPSGLTTSLAGTRILFDGVPAAMIYASSNQISAVVPQSVAGNTTTVIQAELAGRVTNPISVPVGPASPGIFTLDSSGRGRGAILNQDSSVNGTGNPADRDSVIQIFGTGGGLLSPASGSMPPRLAEPISARIGNRDAEILYAGPAPGLVVGVIQINARVPADVIPGEVPVVVSSGDRTSSLYVTVAVR